MNIKKIVLLGIVICLLGSGFYNNSRKSIQPEFYEHWQEVFEFLVVGRLNLSQQEGIWSAGGLLVLGNADEFDFRSKVINYQYEAYKKNEAFERYWVYKSTSGFVGVLLSIVDKGTNFLPGFNLKLFRIGVSLFNGVIFSLMLLWFYQEFGWLAAFLNFLLISFSPWLTLAGGNIYWQLWVFYLPFVVLLFWLKHLSDNEKEYPCWKISVSVSALVLLKILLTGFEFITTFLLMTTVPFVFYALKDKWKLRIFIRGAIKVSLGLLSAVLAGFFILVSQLSLVEGSFLSAFRYLFHTFGRRSFGDGQAYQEPYASAIRANFFDVLKTYLQGPAFSVTSFSQNSIRVPSWETSYLLFIFLSWIQVVSATG
jgi:hypothetical protein